MAVVFEWQRGVTAALAEAISDLDARLAAVEALTAPGAVVSATAVLATASVPSHWVQGAIFATAVTGSASVPSAVPRSAAATTATAVSGTSTVPTPTVTVV